MKKMTLFALCLSLLAAAPAFAEYFEITLPAGSTPVQTDTWSCGPNSASRMMSYYHDRIGQGVTLSCNYSNNYGQFHAECPRSINGTQMPAECQSIGPIPKTLAEFMNTHSNPVKYQAVSNAKIEDLTRRIQDKHPVLALTSVGTLTLRQVIPPSELEKIAEGARTFGVSNVMKVADAILPLMHYVVIKGYDDANQTLVYLDTDGTEVTKPIKDFQAQWNWQVDLSLTGNLQESEELKNSILTFLSVAKLIGKLPVGLHQVHELLDVEGNSMIVADPSTVQSLPAGVPFNRASSQPVAAPTQAQILAPAAVANALQSLFSGLRF